MQKIITKINKFTNHTPGPHPGREFDRIQQFEWHGRKKAKHFELQKSTGKRRKTKKNVSFS